MFMMKVLSSIGLAADMVLVVIVTVLGRFLDPELNLVLESANCWCYFELMNDGFVACNMNELCMLVN